MSKRLSVPFDPVSSSSVVAGYVRSLGPLTLSFVTRVHPNDEMFLYNLRLQRGSTDAAAILYYAKGWQIHHTVREVASWRFGALAGVPSILDFASGFGRATRFLAAEVPGDRIWISEIDPEAVRFQRETFGVSGLASAGDAETFQPQRAFGMIVVSSFFSHLPERRFGAWLARLYGFLEPGGVLLLSVHGASLLAEGGVDWSRGIVFRPESESATLPRRDYGTAWVTDQFVRESVMRECAGAQVSSVPFGFCAHQDLYVIVREPAARLPPLEIGRFPRGYLEQFTFDRDTIRLAGVAVGATEEAPPLVQLWCGQELVESSTVAGTRGGSRAWDFRLPRSCVSPDDVIRVEAVSEKGLANILEMGTLRPHLEGRV